MRKTILAIGGSDSSGGAGIQADLKTITALGGYGATVIAALTAQNTQGVLAAEPVSVDLVKSQLDAVFSDLDVASVKLGMLGSDDVIAKVASYLDNVRPPHVICDPVMRATTGFDLTPSSCARAMREHLFPQAELLTPNIPELEILVGHRITSEHEAEQAGRRLLADCGVSVLVKGGHLFDGEAASLRCVDFLITQAGSVAFASERIATIHTHGTGCIYASAIATYRGFGFEIHDAVRAAKTFVTAAIRRGGAVGKGSGPAEPSDIRFSPRLE